MTARLDVTPKTTEQNRIVRTGKSEAEVTTLYGKKIAPLLFLQQLCQTTLYFDNFWHTYTEVNFQQNCNKIAHLS